MDYKKRIQSKDGYVAHFTKTPFTLQEKTRKLCQAHDQDPGNKEILHALFGVCCDYVNIAPGFHYGVIAFGNPCRVQRLITREDRLEYSEGMEKE